MFKGTKIYGFVLDEGFLPDFNVVEKFMETHFKVNNFGEVLKFIQTMKLIDEVWVSTYRLVIKWSCKNEMRFNTHENFDDMHKRGLGIDIIRHYDILCMRFSQSIGLEKLIKLWRSLMWWIYMYIMDL